MMITEAASLQELLDYAKKSLAEVEAEEVFLVRDLFRGFEWKRITRANRTKLGSMFLFYAGEEAAGQLEILGKTPQNQQIYKKK